MMTAEALPPEEETGGESRPMSDQASHTWADEWRDLMRGVGGAAIIGIPLVYTMEMWQLATLLPPRNVLLLITLALLVNVGYNYASGFRDDSGIIDAVFDAVESYGLAVVFAFVLLVLLRIVDASTPVLDVATKVAVEAIPLSIGISIAAVQFTGGGDSGGGEAQGSETARRRYPALLDAGIAVAGAIVFAFNVAPTEEILLLATRATPPHLLALMVFSLALSYGMIFVADFSGVQQRRSARGLLQTPAGETVMAYALALLVSAGMLYAFHPVTVGEHPYTFAAAMVVLGLPATVGGAAGRLLVSTNL